MTAAASALDKRGVAPALLAIAGSPNVGKSVMFGRLTGRYVVVSNYPGTTVEITEGRARLAGLDVRVIDTPGMYSTLAVTEEERVARRVLLEQRPAAIVHMVDAKNLARMLPLALQLMDLGLPIVLALNMMDEAERAGVALDAVALSRSLGIAVVETVATSARGARELAEAVARAVRDGRPPLPAVEWNADVEEATAAIERLLPDEPPWPRRLWALLLLQGDEEAGELLAAFPAAASEVASIVVRAAERSEHPLALRLAMARQARSREILAACLRPATSDRRAVADWLSDLAMRPLTGVPILLAIVYLGLYRFVGVFGAGDVVDWLENGLFGRWINPWFDGWLARLVPGATGAAYWTRELFGGEYGLVTLGVTYALAIVLPIVSLFFLFFSILEDSGYFPRLALLVDRTFKRIGLNGRAVIPMVLGFGCNTMATMVTRIQETRRERLITTLLLTLAVPCSAQYGVIAGLLARPSAGGFGISGPWLAWAGIVALVFLVTGRVVSRVLPGDPPAFHMELPPLRLPRLGNVVAKTLARMKWYFLEVLPLFLVASLLIWVGRLTGAFDLLVAALRPVVALIGLPAETAPAFLYGFFRRDFGAAGLYTLAEAGRLDPRQMLVACVTLTLMLPCVAQLLIMRKELGGRTAALVGSGVVVTAFAVGGLVNWISVWIEAAR